MWRWQLSELSARTKIKIKIVGLSLALHIMVMLMLFVVYRGYYAQLHIAINPAPHIPVIFLPLHKQLHTQGAVAMPQSQPLKKAVRKNSAKAPTSFASTKKNNKVSKKQEQKKKVVKKKAVAKAPPAKKDVKKEPEKEVLEIKKEIAQEKSMEPIVAPEAAHVAPPAVVPQEVQEALYVGQLEQDALQIQAAIQQEIEQHWKPPIGLGAEVMCQIKVLVGWDGRAQDIQMQEKSGNNAYDANARAAVKAMHFPKAAWGKELVLYFKQ